MTRHLPAFTIAIPFIVWCSGCVSLRAQTAAGPAVFANGVVNNASFAAWLLYRKGIVSQTEVIDASALRKAPMPNRSCIPWKFSCTEKPAANSR